jgi:CheY-like chemotaxis protein
MRLATVANCAGRQEAVEIGGPRLPGALYARCWMDVNMPRMNGLQAT